MTTVESQLRVLSSRYILETNIPIIFLSIPDIIKAIKQYQWNIFPCNIKGWVTVKKNIIFTD
jgi:hypothetical protein